MKKMFFLSVILLLFFSLKSFAATDGQGKIQLSEQAVNQFINYINGDINKGKSLTNKPLTLWISHDGNYAYWWYCPYSSCTPSNGKMERRQCEKGSKQSCSRFARGRFVRWDNGINPKGKAAKFSSKMTSNEIREKLTKLGFYNNVSDINSNIDQVNIKSNSNKSLVEQLDDLSKLFNKGLLTEQEFTDAKKKLLE